MIASAVGLHGQAADASWANSRMIRARSSAGRIPPKGAFWCKVSPASLRASKRAQLRPRQGQLTLPLLAQPAIRPTRNVFRQTTAQDRIIEPLHATWVRPSAGAGAARAPVRPARARRGTGRGKASEADARSCGDSPAAKPSTTTPRSQQFGRRPSDSETERLLQCTPGTGYEAGKESCDRWGAGHPLHSPPKK